MSLALALEQSHHMVAQSQGGKGNQVQIPRRLQPVSLLIVGHCIGGPVVPVPLHIARIIAHAIQRQLHHPHRRRTRMKPRPRRLGQLLRPPWADRRICRQSLQNGRYIQRADRFDIQVPRGLQTVGLLKIRDRFTGLRPPISIHVPGVVSHPVELNLNQAHRRRTDPEFGTAALSLLLCQALISRSRPLLRGERECHQG